MNEFQFDKYVNIVEAEKRSSYGNLKDKNTRTVLYILATRGQCIVASSFEKKR